MVSHGVAPLPPGVSEERFLEGTLRGAQKQESP